MQKWISCKVCSLLKQPSASAIPVIFLTLVEGSWTGESKADTSVGGADCISKPFQFEEVLVRIENPTDVRGRRHCFKGDSQVSGYWPKSPEDSSVLGTGANSCDRHGGTKKSFRRIRAVIYHFLPRLVRKFVVEMAQDVLPLLKAGFQGHLFLRTASRPYCQGRVSAITDILVQHLQDCYIQLLQQF